MRIQRELVPTSLNGDLRRGGWTLSGETRGDTDAITKNTNLRATGRSLSGLVDLADRQWFNGHFTGDPDFSYDRYGSVANWQAATVDAFLSGLDIQDISFAVTASPANSHESASWRFSTIIRHILRKHCNALYDATGVNGAPDGVVTSLDFDTTNSTLFSTVGDHFIVGHSENLWNTLQEIGGGEEGGGEFYRIYVDRRNVIHYNQAPSFQSPKPAARGTLTKEHLRGQVGIRYLNNQPGQRVGQVQMVSGINANTIYRSKYPTSPGYGKIVKKLSGVWAQSQGRADTLAERLYKWLTRLYTLTIEVDPGLVLFGDTGRGLDLADRIYITYNGPAEDSDTGAGVHLNLSAASFFIYGIQINFDPARHTATAILTCEHDNG